MTSNCDSVIVRSALSKRYRALIANRSHRTLFGRPTAGSGRLAV
jgi:hypothetical protein